MRLQRPHAADARAARPSPLSRLIRASAAGDNPRSARYPRSVFAHPRLSCRNRKCNAPAFPDARYAASGDSPRASSCRSSSSSAASARSNRTHTTDNACTDGAKLSRQVSSRTISAVTASATSPARP